MKLWKKFNTVYDTTVFQDSATFIVCSKSVVGKHKFKELSLQNKKNMG